jgi:hypothetical protein
VAWFISLSAQLNLQLTDSIWLKKDEFSVSGTITIKGKTKKIGYHIGEYDDKKVNWEMQNCRHLYTTTFYFNRADVYNKGGEIVLIGTIKKKYKDTVRFRLPTPIKITFPDTIIPILTGDYRILGGQLYFDNGTVFPMSYYPEFAEMLEIEGPAEMKQESGKVLFPSEKYFGPQQLKVRLKSFQYCQATVKVRPVYNDKYRIEAMGSEGLAGYKGEFGRDGCQNCTDRNENGGTGGTGGQGGKGGNGGKIEIWLKSRGDSITVVKSKVQGGAEVLRYVDFSNGGRVFVVVQGGTGGKGGQGGRGGTGADGADGKSPGYGGQGGEGGQGGDGGDGGKVTIYCDTASKAYAGYVEVLNSGGSGGEGGEGGKPGKGGAKENAGIGATLVTGRKGEDGLQGPRGNSGSFGPRVKIEVIVY